MWYEARTGLIWLRTETSGGLFANTVTKLMVPQDACNFWNCWTVEASLVWNFKWRALGSTKIIHVSHKVAGCHGELHGISIYASTQRANWRDGRGIAADTGAGYSPRSAAQVPGNRQARRHSRYHATSGRVQAHREYDGLNCVQNSSVNTRPMGGPLYLLCCAGSSGTIWSACGQYAVQLTEQKLYKLYVYLTL